MREVSSKMNLTDCANPNYEDAVSVVSRTYTVSPFHRCIFHLSLCDKCIFLIYRFGKSTDLLKYYLAS